MTQYIFRRILGLIPVLFGVSLLVFTLTRIIPADPALLILGERATPEARARLQEQLGLNQPLFFNPAEAAETGKPLELFDSQYFDFVGGALTGQPRALVLFTPRCGREFTCGGFRRRSS